jgi:uncharacterized protein
MDSDAATSANLDWSGLEVLSIADCWSLLGDSTVGRFGFVDQGSPVILPVNFVLDGHSIAFKVARGSKLAAAAVEAPVCFEVDAAEEESRTGWSVLAKGVAEVVLDEDDTDRLDALDLEPWARPDLREQWVRVRVEELTGRRIVPSD